MRTKNIYNPKKLILLVFIGMISLSGCKKFLDINQNPNNPNTVDPNLLLPTAQIAISQVVGNSLQVYGGMWSQFWTQGPSANQYKPIDLYAPANTDSDRPWANLYSKALINSQLIIENKGSNLEFLKGMAYLTKAYSFQIATDAFGDIPLGEALHADNVKPKYAAQELVYDSIFNYIDKGVALLSVTGSNNPGAQDLFFQGDVAKWKAFANTLKLKAYLRLSKVNPAKASAGIAAVYATGTPFLTQDVSIKYTSVGGNDNPLYNEIVALGRAQNLVASSTVVNQFVANGDQRRFKFFVLRSGQTEITSIPQGSYNANAGKLVSLPAGLVGANPSTSSNAALAPVKLFSSSESYFLQAEAAARGWASGNVTTLFTKGITESFTATGITDATVISNYLATAKDGPLALAAAVTPEAKVKAIITQKYYAMCGFQGFEAWTEYRRTGYPDFLVVSVAPPTGTTTKPQRMVYPNSEAIYNGNFPGNVDIFTPVWWAK